MISDRETDPEFVISRAKENIENLNIFQTQADAIVREAQAKLDSLAQMVQSNLNEGTNMEGILLGKTKEYAVELDRENFDLRIGLDKELWEAQIRNAEETKRQAEKIGRFMRECKTELTQILRPQGLMPQAQYKAMKRFTFGEQIGLDECTFEWPTLDDLKKLNLKQLPVLKEIRLR